EFCVLLPGCSLDRAATLVENLRRLVPRGLTCSAGVAQWDLRESPESLMLRADAALYDAKRQGRNRSVLAPAPGETAAHRVAPSLPLTTPLFINISVAALLDPEHDPDQLLFLSRLSGRRPQTIVLEISEREQITDPIRLAGAVRAYRECGFRFAVDDVGEGHS